MADPGYNRIMLRMLFVVSIVLLLSAPAAGVTKIELYNTYCVPANTACTNSLCNPQKAGCAGPCTEIYGGERACYGECGNYAINPTCAEPYWSGFMNCLGSCIHNGRPAICAEACQASFEEKWEACVNKQQSTNKVQGTTGNTGSSSSSASTQPPTVPIAASFTATPIFGIAPLTVTFTDTSKGNVVFRSWSFGDGTSGSSNVMAHEYRSPGSYRVSLTVTGSSRETSVAYQTITVNIAPPRGPESVPPVAPLVPPEASIAADPDSGPAPLIVRFTDASSGTISDRVWEFEPGYKSEQPAANHTFRNPGTYTVKLTVSGAGGIDTSMMTIRVTDPLTSGGGGGTTVDNTGSPNTSEGTERNSGSAKDNGTSSTDNTTPQIPPDTAVPDSALAAGAGVAGAAAAGAQSLRKRKPPGNYNEVELTLDKRDIAGIYIDNRMLDERIKIQLNPDQQKLFHDIQRDYHAPADQIFEIIGEISNYGIRELDRQDLYIFLRLGAGFGEDHQLLDTVRDQALPMNEVAARVTLGMDALAKGKALRDDLIGLILNYCAPVKTGPTLKDFKPTFKDMGAPIGDFRDPEKWIPAKIQERVVVPVFESAIDPKNMEGAGGLSYAVVGKVIGYLELPTDLENMVMDLKDASASHKIYTRFIDSYDKYPTKADVLNDMTKIKEEIRGNNLAWQIAKEKMDAALKEMDTIDTVPNPDYELNTLRTEQYENYTTAYNHARDYTEQIREKTLDFAALKIRYGLMEGNK